MTVKLDLEGKREAVKLAQPKNRTIKDVKLCKVRLQYVFLNKANLVHS